MKVLYIVTGFPRNEQDVITPWMIESIERLRRKGVEVTVYVCSYRGLGDQTVHGIPVRRFRYCPRRWEVLSHDDTVPEQIRRNKLFLLLVVPYLIFGVFGLRRVLRREKFDLVHVHWPFPLGVFGYFASRWGGAPMVTQFYGVELRWVQTKMRIFIPFLRWVLRKSALVAAISSHTRAEIEKILPGCRVEIVPYGSPVSPAAGAESPSREPGRARRVLFVGRLVERKGVEFLIRSMRDLKCPWPVELDVVGTGPEEQRLRELVEKLGLGDRVHLRGLVPTEELKRRYAESDCFVLPAVVDSKGDTEGLGVVLIEALSYRKPVIASNLGGIVDIVRHEQTGLLVQPNDPSALAAAIERVLTDQALASRLGEEGFEFVRRYFDQDRIAERWIELYRSLVQEGQRIA
jgi:glycosyltransferase involved in cell wall biosynthesis